MYALIILLLFILIIIAIVFIEYKNEKKYQKQRYKTPSKTPKEPKTAPIQREKIVQPTLKKEEEVKVAPKQEISIKKNLPEANYPQFDHSRIITILGLSEEDAKEFIGELISQIDSNIPLIKEAMAIADFHSMERLTHSIKGSATNLGTGGVAALLIDYNTYLKTGTDLETAQKYFEYLNHYASELKAQYA